MDYKRDVPKELTKTVAAFANTAGGMVLLGVDEEHGAPTYASGMELGRSDLRTRLTSMILADLDPVPDFSIGLVRTATDTERQIAVLRVQAGLEPPYVRRGAVYLRAQDQNAAASQQTIKQLFARATHARARARTDRDSVPNLVVQERNLDGAEQVSKTFMRLWLDPYPGRFGMLHRAREEKIISNLHEVYGDVTLRTSRSFRHTLFEQEVFTELLRHRKWQIETDGRLSFVVATHHDEAQQLCYLPLLALEVLRFLRWGAKQLDELQTPPGRLMFGSQAPTGSLRLVDQGPTLGQTVLALPGVSDATGDDTYGRQEHRVVEAEPSDLLDPNGRINLTVAALSFALLEHRGACIDIQRLTHGVGEIDKLTL